MNRWPLWAPRVAAGTSIGVAAILLLLGRDVAGLPLTAGPAVAVLVVGAVVALRWRTRHWTAGVTLWAVAGLSLAAGCWVLVDLVQFVLSGTVTDRDGHSDWLPFGERLALTLIGVLFVATALSWRRGGRPMPTGRRHPEPQAAPAPVCRLAYAGCLAWLPYAGTHTLGALGVPGIEPDGFRPPAGAVLAGWIGIGLACFLLLGLVRPWGMVFPRWTLLPIRRRMAFGRACPVPAVVPRRAAQSSPVFDPGPALSGRRSARPGRPSLAGPLVAPDSTGDDPPLQPGPSSSEPVHS